MAELALDLGSFFTLPSIEPETLEQYASAAHESAVARDRFEALTREYQSRAGDGRDEALKVALALFILGRYTAALEAFPKAKDGKMRRFYAAEAAQTLGRLEEAEAEYQKAAQQGWDSLEIEMRIAALKLRAGDNGAAEKTLQKHARSGEDRAEWHFVNGLSRERKGEYEQAGEAYERALTLDPDHENAMFRLAALYDLRGDDDGAIELYQRLAIQPRARVNALMNLAVLFEDRDRYSDAISCLRRVLTAFPNHRRARLFVKDVESSRQMLVEDAGEKRIEQRNRILETSLGDMELSVRARNCLKKMRVNTLGELMRLTEEELLAYKNFGETSLAEIRAVLAKRGLRLGQRPDEIDPTTLVEPPPPPRAPVPPGLEPVLSKPVSEIELSVRARRCLQRLNVITIGDLIQRSEPELLAARNFGVTSLNEIKSRLAELGLQLANKP
ncbi:MAG: DNA-directed RNA polymerase subunit alpha C-terminal domain-containing protein [Phycisphaerae bacterium]